MAKDIYVYTGSSICLVCSSPKTSSLKDTTPKAMIITNIKYDPRLCPRLSWRVTATTSTAWPRPLTSYWAVCSASEVNNKNMKNTYNIKTTLEVTMTSRTDWRSSWLWPHQACWGWVRRAQGRTSGTGRVSTSSSTRSSLSPPSSLWTSSSPAFPTRCSGTRITQCTGSIIPTQ